MKRLFIALSTHGDDLIKHVLSPVSSALHQRGHYWATDVTETLIAALEQRILPRLFWWSRPTGTH